MEQSEINAVLCAAKSSSEAMQNLYRLQKQTTKKRSLAYLCKKAGIPSTGYFSDVLSKKRTIHPKYRSGVVRAFDLTGEAAACLQLLIDLDNEAEPKTVSALKSELAACRKSLKVLYRPLRGESQELFVALDLFCAFGLFGNRPTEADLQGYCSLTTKTALRKSLGLLESLGLITREGDRYLVLQDHVLFGSEKGSLSHVEFLKMALAHAANQVATWFERKDQAYFTSTVASVRREEYEGILQEIKRKMLQAQSTLVSEKADMLVRFNVQIYPLSPPI